MEFGTEEILVIKAVYAGVCRRLTLKKNADISQSTLEKNLRELFKLEDSAKISVLYTDNEGDLVSLQDERDLKDALFFQKLNPLRLSISLLMEGREVEDDNKPLESDVSLYIKSLEMEARESFKATEAVLAATLSRVTDAVVNAFHNRSPLLVDVKFSRESLPSFVVGRTNTGALLDEGELEHPIMAEPPLFSVPDGLSNEQAAFSRSVCALCKASPIVGPRYQSLMKADYEVCHTCYKNHDVEGHFRKVPERVRPSPTAGSLSPGFLQYGVENVQGIVHEGIECDRCQMCPIIGPRYKSNLLADFDLCSKCFSLEGEKLSFDEILVTSPLHVKDSHT